MFRCGSFLKIYLYDRLQSTGADAHLLAKMEAGADRKMPHLPVNVHMAGLGATVTSEGSPVKQLLDKEVRLSRRLRSLMLYPVVSIILSQY